MFRVFLISPRHLSQSGNGFCQMIFQHLIRWSYISFFFQFFIWLITLVDFHIWNHPDIFGMKPTWSWLMYFWCVLGLYLPVFYWVFLHPCSWGRLVCNSLSWLSLSIFQYQGNYSLKKKSGNVTSVCIMKNTLWSIGY